MSAEGVTAVQLTMASSEVFAVFRDRARLVKNSVGNLSVVVDGEYVGYLDLSTAEVCWNEGVRLPWLAGGGG